MSDSMDQKVTPAGIDRSTNVDSTCQGTDDTTDAELADGGSQPEAGTAGGAGMSDAGDQAGSGSGESGSLSGDADDESMGSGVDVTPGLGGVGAGDPGGHDPMAPIVNDDDPELSK